MAAFFANLNLQIHILKKLNLKFKKSYTFAIWNREDNEQQEKTDERIQYSGSSRVCFLRIRI
jgi:hypothetical protein